MKFNVAIISFILSIIPFSAVADESAKTGYGITFTSANQLLIRTTVNESSMVYAGIGFSNTQATVYPLIGSSNLSSNRSLTLGGREYFSTNAGLSKFINLEGTRYISTLSFNGGPDYITTSTSASLSYGIEYNIASNLSIEGSAGVKYIWGDTQTSGSTSSFPNALLALTYYW